MSAPIKLTPFTESTEIWNIQKQSPNLALRVYDQPLLPGNKLCFIDFRDRDLKGIDFSGDVINCSSFENAILAYGRFCETRLGGTTFQGADLTASDFSHAWCNGAGYAYTNDKCAGKSTCFIGAKLDRAEFHNASLGNTEFNGSSLKGTKFINSDLENANFENVTLKHTIFSDVDLSSVKGLDTVNHQGPSYIDVQTLIKSKGNLPEDFLRGCGLPDYFIEYNHSLFSGKAIEYYSCFISYSSVDKDFTQRIFADLQNKGIRCWFAPDSLKIGDKVRQTIDNSIRIYDKLLVVLSKNSIMSQWVEKEVETAFNEERKRGDARTILFPIRLDNSVMETNQAWATDIRLMRHIGDFTDWKNHDSYQKAFERLISDLKAS